jgi:hypothetical protein
MRISLTIGATALCFMLPGTLQCQVTPQTISITEDRPLYTALNQFGSQFGWVISYEDPQYEFKDDVEGVPQNVSRDSSIKPLLGKRAELLSASFDKPADFNDPQAEEMVLHRLLEAYQSSSGKVFTLQKETEGRRVIVPELIKNSEGELKHVTPLLDTPVNVKLKDATGSQFLEYLCNELSKLSGVKVEPATISSDAAAEYKGNFDYSGISARKALSEFLGRVNGGDRLFWALLYQPGYGYGLNILDVKPVNQPAADRQRANQRACTEGEAEDKKSNPNGAAGSSC